MVRVSQQDVRETRLQEIHRQERGLLHNLTKSRNVRLCTTPSTTCCSYPVPCRLSLLCTTLPPPPLLTAQRIVMRLRRHRKDRSCYNFSASLNQSRSFHTSTYNVIQHSFHFQNRHCSEGRKYEQRLSPLTF